MVYAVDAVITPGQRVPKVQFRDWGRYIEALSSPITGVYKTTQALLFADLSAASPAWGWVYADTPDKVGPYIKEGGAGVGSWIKIPDTVQALTVQLALLDPVEIGSDSGYLIPFLDENYMLVGGWKSDGTFKATFAWDCVFPDSFIEQLLDTTGLLPVQNICCAGDSWTAGAVTGGPAHPYTLMLATLLPGRTIVNTGIGGQQSNQIAARLGGLPITVTVTSDQIPASGGVSVTAKNINILFNSGAFTGSSVGTMLTGGAGIHGTMTTDGSGNWTFTRSTAGSVTACPPGTVFFPDFAETHENDTYVIMMGINDSQVTVGQDPFMVVDNMIAIAKFLKPKIPRLFVVSLVNGTGEGIGQGSVNPGTGLRPYDRIKRANDDLELYFGSFFINARRLLIRDVLSYAGITPTSDDLADIAADTMPRSALSDSRHGINETYDLLGIIVANAIKAKGA